MRDAVPAKLDALTHEVGETGDIIVFDAKGNQLLMLNDVGAAVWLLVNGERSVGQIAELIVETLPADVGSVEQDVQRFVESLVENAVLTLG